VIKMSVEKYSYLTAWKYEEQNSGQIEY